MPSEGEEAGLDPLCQSKERNLLFLFPEQVFKPLGYCIRGSVTPFPGMF